MLSARIGFCRTLFGYTVRLEGGLLKLSLEKKIDCQYMEKIESLVSYR